jgi:regulator of sigma E protease
MQYDSESPTLAQSLALLAEVGRLETNEVLSLERRLGYDLEGDLDQLTDWGTIRRSKSKTPGETGAYSYEMVKSDRDSGSRSEVRGVFDAQALLETERKKTYLGASYIKRVVMLVTGAVFNLLFAIVVFTTAMTLIGEVRTTTTVDVVVSESPAEAAGMLPGDRLVAIDGRDILNWEEVYDFIGQCQSGQEIVITVMRDEQLLELNLVLAENNGRGYMGVMVAVEQVPVAFGEAFTRSIGFIGEVAAGIMMLFNPATFGEVLQSSSSVVGISVEASNAASAGFWPFIMLAAALSISIGLMNLLPFPPLDGGKILLETIQRVTKRKIPIRVINSISVLVLVLFGILFVVLTWQDIRNYIM